MALWEENTMSTRMLGGQQRLRFQAGLAGLTILATLMVAGLFSPPARAVMPVIRPAWFPEQLAIGGTIAPGNPKADALVSTPARGCTPGPNAYQSQPGTYLLARYLSYHWGSGRIMRIYGCTKVAGSPYWSLHAEGRAVDFRLDDRNPNERRIGDITFEWFLRTVRGKPAVMARRWGVQEIIWRCAIWSVTGGLHYYPPCRTSSDRTIRHENHIHIGQNPFGAGGYTTAYTGYRPNW